MVMEAIAQALIEMVLESNNVLIQKKSFAELSSYLTRIVPLLNELNKKDVCDSECLKIFLDILNHQMEVAKQLIRDCSEKNRFYLFLNCRSVTKRIGDITLEISHGMSCLSLNSLYISGRTREDINQLISNMQSAEFKIAVTEEDILEKIELGIHERNVDSTFANDLLVSIAKAIGVSTDCVTLKREFEEFKSEIENLKLRKNKAEAIQMDQIIALLERADVASSLEDRGKKYLTKRKSLGVQPLEPLVSFSCPITKEVMVDPVESPSGQTFERTAIEKWLSGKSNPMCPVTLTPLHTSMLRPNKTLRQSIEEWQERKTMIIVASLKSRLSGEKEEVYDCLKQLVDLCEQKEKHKEWLILEDYIPNLVELLRAKDRNIRNGALLILKLLAKYNDDAKELIAKVENAIKYIVQSLGRQIAEGKLAVALLLEMSKCKSVCDHIGNVQGCILLLITMLRNDDHQAATDAKNVLANLSFSDDNVILMANNNYFEYLMQRLSTGPDDVKMVMAKTLWEIELTNHNKSSLVENGVLNSLLELIAHDDVEMKLNAVGALLNLSSLKNNGQEIIKKVAVPLLLDILYNQLSPQRLRELVADTIVFLALSTIPEDSGMIPVPMLESDEDVHKLFSLISFAEPAVQQNILRIFHAMCLSPFANFAKSKLIQCSAVQMSFLLCEVDNLSLRSNAVNLLCCLTEDEDPTTFLEYLTQPSIETLLRIIKESNKEEEIASALGTISHLPNSAQISEWLLESHNLSAIFSALSDVTNTTKRSNRFIESAAGAVCRLTINTNVQLQKKVAEAGIVPILVQLLETGRSLTRKRAAISLSQLSLSSPSLSRRISRRIGLSCFFASPETEACPVHRGLCTVTSSFCLIKACAITPLVQVLRGEPDPESCEAALDALFSLMDNEMLQNGCKVLEEADAIPVIIKLLTRPSPCVKFQEKVMSCLARIFLLAEYKQKYGSSAQMLLVDLTQQGNRSLKSLAAKILVQLNVLNDQSSFF